MDKNKNHCVFFFLNMSSISIQKINGRVYLSTLVALDFSFLLFAVVCIIVGKCIFNQGSKHKDITDPEIHVQSFDGRGAGQRRASADHQCCHSENCGDPWKQQPQISLLSKLLQVKCFRIICISELTQRNPSRHSWLADPEGNPRHGDQ